MNSEELKNRTKLFAHRCVRLAVNIPNYNTLGKHKNKQQTINNYYAEQHQEY